MAYVFDSFNTSYRQVLLRDDWNSFDYKQLTVNEWTGYEDDIDVKIDGDVAVITLSDGTVKRFDLSAYGNIPPEI